MSVQSIALADLESAPAAKFDTQGDTHRGTIVSLDHRQQTDPVSKTPKTFDSGAPMMVWVITIQPSDSEEALALWARGGRCDAAVGSGDPMLTAIAKAVKGAGASALMVGGELAVSFTGLGKADPGLSPTKLFTAQYRTPALGASVADLFGDALSHSGEEPF
jgi:hypothetical protein